MPASAHASETFFLQLIWMGSLALSALSILVMIVLILRRISLENKGKVLAARRQEILRCFYAVLRSPVAVTLESLPRVKKEDHPLIMRGALDTLRTMQGEDTKRIVEVLKLWGMRPYLKRTADKGRKGRRIQAITLLGYFDDETSLDILLGHILDSDIYVQIAALRGLAQRGATQHIAQITHYLSQSGQTNTLMLSDILSRFGEVAVPSLLELASSHANSEMRMAAVIALGTIGSLQAVDTLIQLADDPEVDIRARAITALGKIGDNRAGEVILSHLEENDAAVRVQAAQALGGLQIMAALPRLAARLSDDDWWVRFRAAEALYQFGDKGIAALKSFSVQQNKTGLIARQVLGELGGI